MGFLCLGLFCMHFTLYLRSYDPAWCDKEAWDHRWAAVFGESEKHHDEAHGCDSHSDGADDSEEESRKNT